MRREKEMTAQRGQASHARRHAARLPAALPTSRVPLSPMWQLPAEMVSAQYPERALGQVAGAMAAPRACAAWQLATLRCLQGLQQGIP